MTAKAGLSEVTGRVILPWGRWPQGWAAERICVATEVELHPCLSAVPNYGDLIVKAEPAHEALGLLRMLLVQGDETGEDFGLRQVGQPAVGGGDGSI